MRPAVRRGLDAVIEDLEVANLQAPAKNGGMLLTGPSTPTWGIHRWGLWGQKMSRVPIQDVSGYVNSHLSAVRGADPRM